MDVRQRLVTNFALRLVFCAVSLAVAMPVYARDWNVPTQAPTIQAAVDSCVTGDVVVISPGTYTDCTHLNGNGVAHIALLKNGVSLRGSTGDPADVILDAQRLGRCLEMRDVSGAVEIEGITLLRGIARNPFGSGGAIFVFRSEPTFRHCVFDSNHAEYAGGALAVSYGQLDVENCVFTNSSTDNIGAAIRVTNSVTTVTSSTIYGSTGAAIHYAGADLTLTSCLIVDGDAESVLRNQTSDPMPTITCSDFYGNDSNWPDFVSELEDDDGNISANPYFCNPLFGEFTLYAISPCAPENSGDCGQIGALSVGCGSGGMTHFINPDGSGSYTTIQAALNASADGDTIALTDGVFSGDGNRDLDFLGKAVVVKGLSGDPAQTIIDCEGTLAEPHRGFHFFRDEDGSSALRDLTIINGDVADNGGAILCESDPKITNCVFQSNHASIGAAIYVDHASPEITDCLILENEGRQRAGGFAFYASSLTIKNCLFRNNWGYRASAISLPDSSTVTVENCTFNENASSEDKACLGASGNSTLSVKKCIISNGNRFAARDFDLASILITDSCVYNNTSGDFVQAIDGQEGKNGNISADPLYCDLAADTYTLRGDSPCTEYSSYNRVQMGAFGADCAAPTQFTDISDASPSVPAASRGAAWVDVNNDGHADVFVANQSSNSELFLGDGTGNFIDYTSGLNNYTGQILSGSWADYDRDGDLDLYLSIADSANLLLTNTDGVFTDAEFESLGAEGPAGPSSWTDLSGDEFMDLFIARNDSTSQLMNDNTSGDFSDNTNILPASTGIIQAAAWCDYDNDGDNDLYLVQDGRENVLFKNGGQFTDGTGNIIDDDGPGRGAAWGDYDNDKDMDLFLARDGQQNFLYKNHELASFKQISTSALGDEGPARSGIWGDWDNDGDLDLFVTNCGAADQLLRNAGGDQFIDTKDPVFAASDSSAGASFGDFDSDGDLDLLVADIAGATRIYRNDTAGSNHWLQLDLTRFSGQSFPHGARVRIVTADSLSQVREISAECGWYSSNYPRVHFGLGSATIVDSLIVKWPNDSVTTRTNIGVDQVMVLIEHEYSAVIEDGAGSNVPRLNNHFGQAVPNPFNPATRLDFELAVATHVRINVYNLAGRKVKELVNEKYGPGRHEVFWRGRDQSDRAVAAGVYLCRMVAGDFVQIRAMTLIK